MHSLTWSDGWGCFMLLVEAGVCILAWIRRLQHRLPFFTAYLVLLVAIDAVRWWSVMLAGAESRAYSWIFWLTQPVLLLARGLALVDLCRAAAQSYPGVWRLARFALAVAAIAMLALGAARTAGSRGMASYFIFVERELETAIVLILVLLLMLNRYYGVPLEKPLSGIAFGLAFYSSVVVINSTFLMGPFALSWPLWSAVRIAAFDVALVAWALALRRPLPGPVQLQLVPVVQFEQASAAMDQGMRELSARVFRIARRYSPNVPAWKVWKRAGGAV